MRVRGFTQDDAHIFCTPDQLQDEIQGVLDLTQAILTKFGFASSLSGVFFCPSRAARTLAPPHRPGTSSC